MHFRCIPSKARHFWFHPVFDISLSAVASVRPCLDNSIVQWQGILEARYWALWSHFQTNIEWRIDYISENMTLGFVSFYNIDVCCAVGTNTAPNDRQNWSLWIHVGGSWSQCWPSIRLKYLYVLLCEKEWNILTTSQLTMSRGYTFDS